MYSCARKTVKIKREQKTERVISFSFNLFFKIKNINCIPDKNRIMVSDALAIDLEDLNEINFERAPKDAHRDSSESARCHLP